MKGVGGGDDGGVSVCCVDARFALPKVSSDRRLCGDDSVGVAKQTKPKEP